MRDLKPKKGDEAVVKIIQLDEDGDGIASLDGYIFYVPDTLPGQLVKVQIQTITGRVLHCDLLGIYERGPEDENKENQDGVQ
jgi:23S rRNA (uracil1939-C5)-methyltransferase